MRLFVALVLATIVALMVSCSALGAPTALPFAHPHDLDVILCLRGEYGDKRDNVQRAINEWNAETLYEFQDFDAPGCPPDLDVVLVARLYGDTGWWGQTAWTGPCSEGPLDSVHCELVTARINRTYLQDENYAAWRYVACHELGHTVGMEHGTADCMQPGADPDLYRTISMETALNLNLRLAQEH